MTKRSIDETAIEKLHMQEKYVKIHDNYKGGVEFVGSCKDSSDSKRLKKLVPSPLSLCNILKELSIDWSNLNIALDLLVHIRELSYRELFLWDRESHDIIVRLGNAMLGCTFFPSQQCLYASLSHVFCLLENHQCQDKAKKIHNSLPLNLQEALPLTNEADLLNTIKMRQRLNKLNKNTKNIASYRVNKCWMAAGRLLPERISIEGWVDLGRNVLSFCRDDEALTIVNIPYLNFRRIRFNTIGTFCKVYFQSDSGDIQWVGFAIQEKYFPSFRRKIKSCFSRAAANRRLRVNQLNKQLKFSIDCPSSLSPNRLSVCSSLCHFAPCNDASQTAINGQLEDEKIDDDVEQNLIHARKIQLAYDQMHTDACGEVQERTSLISIALSHVGATQVHQVHAMGRLEYDFKSLAQDVQNMQSVTMPDWESKADSRLSYLCNNLNEASFATGQHLSESLKLIDEAKKREKKSSNLSLIAAFSTPWIIYAIFSLSLGYA